MLYAVKPSAPPRSAPLPLLVLAACCLAVACDRDEGTALDDGYGEGRARLRVELTDAPIDDANLEAVVVTVAEVRLDGERQPLLSGARTVRLSDLTDGRVAALGTEQTITAGIHANLEVVLDLANDERGDAPGCYALLADGSRVALGSPNAGTLTLSSNAGVRAEAGQTTRYIVDVDLRRAVEYGGPGAGDMAFAPAADVAAATRFLDADATGAVRGEVRPTASAPPTDRLVLYVYPAGRFDAAYEAERGYRGAVTSCRVRADGRFTFAFLPEGDYELVAVDYADADGDGRVEARAQLSADALIEQPTRAVGVTAGAETSVRVDLGAALDFVVGG